MIDDKEVLIDSSEPVETAKTDPTSTNVPDQKSEILFGASTYQSQIRDSSHNYLQIFLLLSLSVILFYLILSNGYEGTFITIRIIQLSPGVQEQLYLTAFIDYIVKQLFLLSSKLILPLLMQGKQSPFYKFYGRMFLVKIFLMLINQVIK